MVWKSHTAYCIVLRNDFMRPAKLKQHLQNVHSQSKHKDKSYFERQNKALNMMRLDSSGGFFTNSKIVEASHEVALETAKQKKPHHIEESLINPCVLKVANKVLSKDAQKTLATVSLSNNTIQRRTRHLSDDIKSQVVQQIKNSLFGLFAIQLDESTDVSFSAQSVVFINYIYNCAFEEKFHLQLSGNQYKSNGDFRKSLLFFKWQWQNLAGCCTNGPPAMFGCNSGFQALMMQLQ